jgi:hypothetical protein
MNPITVMAVELILTFATKINPDLAVNFGQPLYQIPEIL